LFATRKWDYGNNFNGTTFRAPTNGFYNFNSSVYDIPNAGTPYSTYSDIILEMNGNIICRAIPRAFNALGYTIGIVSVSGYYLTNGAQVKVKIDCDAGTNKINPGVTTTFFESNLIRELP